MLRWLNPRVLVVGLSIFVMVQVSRVGDPQLTIRHDKVVCSLMLALYAIVFLVPLARSLGWRAILAPAVLLAIAWLAVALALIADATPQPFYVQMQRRYNWPMIAFCTAGFAAFFLFFTQMARSFALRDDILEARSGRP